MDKWKPNARIFAISHGECLEIEVSHDPSTFHGISNENKEAHDRDLGSQLMKFIDTAVRANEANRTKE